MDTKEHSVKSCCLLQTVYIAFQELVIISIIMESTASKKECFADFIINSDEQNLKAAILLIIPASVIYVVGTH